MQCYTILVQTQGELFLSEKPKAVTLNISLKLIANQLQNYMDQSIGIAGIYAVTGKLTDNNSHSFRSVYSAFIEVSCAS